MSRTARIEARIAPEQLANVRRAAEVQGRSVSDFVVTAAIEAANKVIIDAEMIRLGREAQRQLAGLLVDPPEPNQALKAAFARHRDLVGD